MNTNPFLTKILPKLNKEQLPAIVMFIGRDAD